MKRSTARAIAALSLVVLVFALVFPSTSTRLLSITQPERVVVVHERHYVHDGLADVAPWVLIGVIAGKAWHR